MNENIKEDVNVRLQSKFVFHIVRKVMGKSAKTGSNIDEHVFSQCVLKYDFEVLFHCLMRTEIFQTFIKHLLLCFIKMLDVK